MDLEERSFGGIGSCATFFGNKLILFSAMAMPLRSSHFGINVLPSTKWEPLLKPMFWTQEAIAVGAALARWCLRGGFLRGAARRAFLGAAAACFSAAFASPAVLRLFCLESRAARAAALLAAL